MAQQLDKKKKVLFLCTGNSCRSQRAEGWAKALKSDELEVYSAGTETHGLNPSAVSVMAEVGVDISGHYSKTLADLSGVRFDVVFTVCDHASQACPSFSDGTKVVHTPFDDPPALAANMSDEVAELNCYRQVRDQIRTFVDAMDGVLAAS